MNEYLNIVLPAVLGLVTTIAGWFFRSILSDLKEKDEKLSLIENKLVDRMSQLENKLNDHTKDDIRVQQKLEVEVDAIFRNLDKVDIKLDKILEK